MPVRARALALTLLLVLASIAGALPGVRPTTVAAAGPKVAIIVGPVGSMTSSYRTSANRVADAAIGSRERVLHSQSIEHAPLKKVVV